MGDDTWKLSRSQGERGKWRRREGRMFQVEQLEKGLEAKRNHVM